MNNEEELDWYKEHAKAFAKLADKHKKERDTITEKFLLLRAAIQKHKRDMWGEEGTVSHPEDQELYRALEEVNQ